jgi:methyl halide transferase
MPKTPEDWIDCYASEQTPWDTHRPSSELKRVLDEWDIPPSRALDLGCGTGSNVVFLAKYGFDVMGLDVSPLAIEQATQLASSQGVLVSLDVADLLKPFDIPTPFPFVFDRGVYHVLRKVDLQRYLETLHRVIKPGGFYLTLAGNANESRPGEVGPPRVSAETLCVELGDLFELVQLREFRFDASEADGKEVRPLAWSALFRRKTG